MEITKFIARWSQTSASEKGNKDLFLLELCDALGVPRPEGKMGDPGKDSYGTIRNFPTRFGR